MSDRVSGEYQTKEIMRATRPLGEYSDEANCQTHASIWSRELPRMTPSEVDESRPWPDSNRTKDETSDEEGPKDSSERKVPKTTSMTTLHVY